MDIEEYKKATKIISDNNKLIAEKTREIEAYEATPEGQLAMAAERLFEQFRAMGVCRGMLQLMTEYLVPDCSTMRKLRKDERIYRHPFTWEAIIVRSPNSVKLKKWRKEIIESLDADWSVR